MTRKIKVRISECDGNFPDNFIIGKYQEDFTENLNIYLCNEYPDTIIDIDVDVLYNLSGITPEPIITTTNIDDSTQLEIREYVLHSWFEFRQYSTQNPEYYYRKEIR